MNLSEPGPTYADGDMAGPTSDALALFLRDLRRLADERELVGLRDAA